MRVPGLARKFCTITSCTCGPAAAIARSASSRSARVSPIPIRIPVVNGTRASPASRSVSSRAAGSLSGEPKCGPPRRESRSAVVSSIIPIEAATGRRAPRSRAASSTPGLRCGRSAVSSSTARAAAARYSSVEAIAERGELLARRAVAQLGLVAEREEGLAAAGLLARAREREHLVDRQVGPLAAARRPRERAVVADVAAELRQRDEDLRAVGHERSRAGARAARAPSPSAPPVGGRAAPPRLS